MIAPKPVSDTGLSPEQEQALALARARRRRAEAEAAKPAPVTSKAPPAPVAKPGPAIPASGMGAMGSRAPADAAAYAATVPQIKPQTTNPQAPGYFDPLAPKTPTNQDPASPDFQFNWQRDYPQAEPTPEVELPAVPEGWSDSEWYMDRAAGMERRNQEALKATSNPVVDLIRAGDKALMDAGGRLAFKLDPKGQVPQFISENVTPAAQKLAGAYGAKLPYGEVMAPLAEGIGGGLSEFAATTARNPVQGATEATDLFEPTHMIARGANNLTEAGQQAMGGDFDAARQSYMEATPDILFGTMGVLPAGSAIVNGVAREVAAPRAALQAQATRVLNAADEVAPPVGRQPPPASQAAPQAPPAAPGAVVQAPPPVVAQTATPPVAPVGPPPLELTPAQRKAADLFIRKMEADGISVDDLRKIQASLSRRGDSGVYETAPELAGLTGKSSGANLRGLAMAAGAAPGPAQEALIGRVAENTAKLPDRLSRGATRATGQSAENAVATLDDLETRLRTQAAPAYDEAYAAPVDPKVFQNEILPVLNTPSGQEAILAARNNLAAKVAELQGRAARGVSERSMAEWKRAEEALKSIDAYLADPVKGSAIPTTMALDYTKRAFDDVITRAGFGSDTARIVGGTKRNFADSVNEATGGKYGAALGIFEDVKRLEDAFEVGLGALGKKTWQLEREMAKGRGGSAWSGGEIEAIAMGVARHIEDLIEAGDQRALTTLMKGKALQNIATALGSDKAARLFEQTINRLAANREFGRRVAGGSDTAMRQAAIRDAGVEGEDAVTNILDRVEKAGNTFSLPGLINDVAIKPVARGAKNVYRQVRYPGVYDPKVNAELAPMLANAMRGKDFDDLIAKLEARVAQKKQRGGKKAAPAPGVAKSTKKPAPASKIKSSRKPPAKTGGKKPPQSNALATTSGAAVGFTMAPDLDGDGQVSGAERVAAATVAAGTFGGARRLAEGGSKPKTVKPPTGAAKASADELRISESVNEMRSRGVSDKNISDRLAISGINISPERIDYFAKLTPAAGSGKFKGNVVRMQRPEPPPGAGGKPPPVGAKAAPPADVLELPKSQRVYAPGRPDDLGFITSPEQAFANPPARFRDAKKLSPEQWRKYMREAGASKEGFTYQIEPALKALQDAGYTGDIPREAFEEALARIRSTLKTAGQTAGAGPSARELWLREEIGFARVSGKEPKPQLVQEYKMLRAERARKGGVPEGADIERDYSAYVAPGLSTGYKQEVLLLPGVDYKSHNWNSRGPVGHIRTTNRVATDGTPVRHVEELQSDLHQEGAKYGYKGQDRANAEKIAAQAKDAADRYTQWRRNQPAHVQAPLPWAMSRTDLVDSIQDPVGRELFRTASALDKQAKSFDAQPPRAPMENWEEPFVRHVLQQAAKDGVDTVTFPSSKSLHEGVLNDGTEAFYDQRLPRTLERVAKSLGASIQTVEMPIPWTNGLAEKVRTQTANAIRLTPEAKQILSRGVMMDAAGVPKAPPVKPQRADLAPPKPPSSGGKPPPAQAGFGGGKGPPKPPRKPKPLEMRRAATRGNKPFSDPRLSPGENKTAEMLLNGYTYPEIADEMLTSLDVIKQNASRAQRKLGTEVTLPLAGQGKRTAGSTKREAAFELFDSGADNTQIAERLGMSVGNVRTYRSYWKQKQSAPVANVNGASYNPPLMPSRPFEADYPQKDWPNGPPVDAQGRLTRDIDGKPLNQNALIVGRRKAPGDVAGIEADRPLRNKDATIQTLRNTGSDFERMPRSVMPSQTDGYWYPDFASNGRSTGRGVTAIADDMDRQIAGLDDRELMVIAHELAHNIDFKSKPARSLDAFNEREWGINHLDPNYTPASQAKLQLQLERIYSDLNNAPGSQATIKSPLDRGYSPTEEARELWAEAIRAYMWDPNYIKTVAPDVAFLIRHHVNKNPSLRKTIQFNAAPLLVGGSGAALGLAVAGQGDQE